MCFVLYVASRSKPPLIGFRPEAPALNTKELNEHTQSVRDKFTLPHVVYVGSDQGCGCGFRFLLREQVADADLIFSDDVEADPSRQRNQQQLRDFLLEKFKDEPFVELFGCWSGDEAQPAEFNDEIPLQRIVDLRFSFRERGFYRISLTKNPTNTG